MLKIPFALSRRHVGVNGTAALLRAGGITIAKQVMKTVPNKALTKTLWYPILKKVLRIFGVNLTKEGWPKEWGNLFLSWVVSFQVV